MVRKTKVKKCSEQLINSSNENGFITEEVYLEETSKLLLNDEELEEVNKILKENDITIKEKEEKHQ